MQGQMLTEEKIKCDTDGQGGQNHRRPRSIFATPKKRAPTRDGTITRMIIISPVPDFVHSRVCVKAICPQPCDNWLKYQKRTK